MNQSPWKKNALIGAGGLLLLIVVMLVASNRFEAVEQSTDGNLIFADDFERTELGPLYSQGLPDPGHKTAPWRIERFCEPSRTEATAKDLTPMALQLQSPLEVELPMKCNRKLVGANIHNAALWLSKKMPKRVRVEFVAEALTDLGDVKAEIFTDGKTHQSGYILIMGGWSNQLNIIARQDEHGEDRKKDARCPVISRRKACVTKYHRYHWAIERREDTVEWFLDGKLFMKYQDRFPIRGEHFGFNNWEAKVAFDDLKIFELP